MYDFFDLSLNSLKLLPLDSGVDYSGDNENLVQSPLLCNEDCENCIWSNNADEEHIYCSIWNCAMDIHKRR